jgi:hypothetical protein
MLVADVPVADAAAPARPLLARMLLMLELSLVLNPNPVAAADKPLPAVNDEDDGTEDDVLEVDGTLPLPPLPPPVRNTERGLTDGAEKVAALLLSVL